MAKLATKMKAPKQPDLFDVRRAGGQNPARANLDTRKPAGRKP